MAGTREVRQIIEKAIQPKRSGNTPSSWERNLSRSLLLFCDDCVIRELRRNDQATVFFAFAQRFLAALETFALPAADSTCFSARVMSRPAVLLRAFAAELYAIYAIGWAC